MKNWKAIERKIDEMGLKAVKGNCFFCHKEVNAFFGVSVARNLYVMLAMMLRMKNIPVVEDIQFKNTER